MAEKKLYTKSELQSLSMERQTLMFDDLLRRTGRQNIENLISWLHGTDFYTAPASSNGSSNYVGGLLYHSLSVYNVLLGLNETTTYFLGHTEKDFDESSMILVSLLHDICLVHTFTQAEKRKQINGIWHSVSTYDFYDQFPVGHGEKSLLFVSMCGISLSRDEIMAIRWHGGVAGLSESELPIYYSAVKTSNLARLLTNAIDISRSYMEESREFTVIDK